MPPRTPQLTTDDSHFVLRIHKKLATGLVILLAVALVGGGIAYHIHYQNSHRTKSVPEYYAYTYSKLSPYKLTGGQAGSGVSFNRPTELGGPSSITIKGKTATASQIMTQNNQPFTVAQFTVAVVPSSTSAGFTKSLGGVVTNSQNPSFNTVLTPIKQFVTTHIGGAYIVTFSTPTTLQTSNLSSNAWSINFTAKPVDSTMVLLPNLQGEEIFAVGQKTYYYFFIDAVDYNWQANQSVFQQVINSLKIDQ